MTRRTLLALPFIGPLAKAVGASAEPEYECPVCFFAMDSEPSNHNICACCMTEFGYDDANRSYEELRREHIALAKRGQVDAHASNQVHSYDSDDGIGRGSSMIITRADYEAAKLASNHKS